MSKGISVSKARSELSDLVTRVSARGERITLQRHGKQVAAIIPYAELEVLQRLEDHVDLQDAARICAKDDFMPLDDFLSELRI